MGKLSGILFPCVSYLLLHVILHNITSLGMQLNLFQLIIVVLSCPIRLMNMHILMKSSFFQFRSLLGEYLKELRYFFSPLLYVVTPHQGTALAGQACHHPPCSHCHHPCADRVNTTLSHSEAPRKAADRWLGAPEHIHDCVRFRSSTNS